ncbi:MAG TPA: ROK family protein, partial [Geobacteraceae bacterium]
MRIRKAVVGIDLGGTNLRFALVRAEGAIVKRLRQPTSIHEGWESLLGRLAAGVAQLAEEAAAEGITVEGVGIGVPGLIGSDGFVHSSVNLLPLEGRNIGEALKRSTGFPVVAANDANAIAFGEKMYGAGRGFSSFLMFTIGTGIGSGLVLDGRLWKGRDGFAAEYGHATVEPDGLDCGCGNHGCLERYASATAIVDCVTKELRRGRESSLAAIPETDLSAEHVAEAASAGDELARSVYVRAGRYLGVAAASAVSLLNLEAIILGGGVAASF